MLGSIGDAARDVWRGMVWCGVESGMNEHALEWTLEWKFQQFDDPTVWLPDVQRNSSGSVRFVCEMIACLIDCFGNDQ